MITYEWGATRPYEELRSILHGPLYLPYDLSAAVVAIARIRGKERIVGTLTWYSPEEKHQRLPCMLCLEGDCHQNAYMIRLIKVDHDWRRKGVATGMYRFAKTIEPRVRNSNVRTYEGDKWARSNGDHVPRQTGRCSDPSGYAHFRGDCYAVWPPVVEERAA